jgi:hypothetical protein
MTVPDVNVRLAAERQQHYRRLGEHFGRSMAPAAAALLRNAMEREFRAPTPGRE